MEKNKKNKNFKEGKAYMYSNNVVKEDLKKLAEQNIDFKKLYNKSILITGATGMLASYYMYLLMYLNDNKNANIKIYALVRNKSALEKLTNYSKRKDIVLLEQDVCDKIEVNEKIDYIIHMASMSNPKTITSAPVEIIKANVLGTLNVLNLAKEKNAMVLFTSTREVYGKVENVEKILEADLGKLDQLELRSCYPESKRQAENLIVSYAYQYGIKYKIVRIAHVYGPEMNIDGDGRIMSDLISNIVRKENIILKSTGEAKRAFCYITDAISALIYVTIEGKENEVYNISNETEEISIKDLAYMLKDMYEGIDVIFDIQENKNQYVKFERVPLNTEKLESLGWKPQVTLKEGISNAVNFFKENIKE